jgi:hypothetical protein
LASVLESAKGSTFVLFQWTSFPDEGFAGGTPLAQSALGETHDHRLASQHEFDDFPALGQGGGVERENCAVLYVSDQPGRWVSQQQQWSDCDGQWAFTIGLASAG